MELRQPPIPKGPQYPNTGYLVSVSIRSGNYGFGWIYLVFVYLDTWGIRLLLPLYAHDYHSGCVTKIIVSMGAESIHLSKFIYLSIYPSIYLPIYLCMTPSQDRLQDLPPTTVYVWGLPYMAVSRTCGPSQFFSGTRIFRNGETSIAPLVPPLHAPALWTPLSLEGIQESPAKEILQVQAEGLTYVEVYGIVQVIA